MHIRRLLEEAPGNVIPTEFSGTLTFLIPALESIRVNTIEAFLFTSPAVVWDALHAKGAAEASYLTPSNHAWLRKQALKALTEADRGLGISTHAGDQAWDQEKQESRDVHWDGFGLSGLDELLEGIGSSVLIELVGGKGAGKSLLTLHAVLRHLIVDPSRCCVWVDTEAAFSAVRAAGILKLMGVSDIESVLLRIQVIPCFDVSTLSDIVRAVQEDLEMDPDSAEPEHVPEAIPANPDTVPTSQAIELELDLTRRVRSPSADEERPPSVTVGVVVIDSITPLLAPLINSNSSENQARATAVMSSLMTLTRRHSLLTLVTNGTSPLFYYNPATKQTRTTAPSLPSVFGSTTVRPGLKTGFEYWADVTLLVQKEMDVLAGDLPNGNNLAPTWQTQTTASQAPGSQITNGRPQSSKRIVEVLKNRFGPSSTWTTFDVTA